MRFTPQFRLRPETLVCIFLYVVCVLIAGVWVWRPRSVQAAILPEQWTNDIASTSISGRVWHDRDGDQIQDNDEPGLVNMVVVIQDSAGVIQLVRTNYRGVYTSAALAAGVYVVRLDTSSLDPLYNLPTTPRRHQLVLEAGQQVTTAHFGYKAHAIAFSNQIWYDANMNGLFEPDEPGMGNVRLGLYLDDDHDGSFNPTFDYLVDTSVSDEEGHYRLDAVIPGNYFIDVLDHYGVLSGLHNTIGPQSLPDPTPLLKVQADQIRGDVDFGYVLVPESGNGVIGGLVWRDGNGNGVWDQREDRLVQTSICATRSSDGFVGCQTTDINGRYLLELPAGSYAVTVHSTDIISLTRLGVVLPSISVQVSAGVQTLTEDLAGVANATSTLGGTIWQDLAQNDVVDGLFMASQEPTIPGVWVALQADSALSQPWSGTDPYLLVASDLAGDYLFQKLPAGDYSVKVLDFQRRLSHFAVSSLGPQPGQDTNNQAQPFVITALADTTYVNADFGYREYDVSGVTDPPSAGLIGDRIWLDLDMNGRYDADGLDQPLVGVTVALYQQGLLWRSATTGTDGRYLFSDLQPGFYSVAVTDRFGRLSRMTPSAPGIPETQADVSQTQPYALMLGFAPTNLSADFAYVQQVAVGDRIWWDLDEDGAEDDGEVGISGVKINLLDSQGQQVRHVESDSEGRYYLGGVAPGSYAVEIDQTEFAAGGRLERWYLTTQLAPSAASADLSQVTVPVELAQGEYHDSMDFGFGIDSASTVTLQQSMSVIRPTQQMEMRVAINNTGDTWLTRIPLQINYPATYLTLVQINGLNPDVSTTGHLVWTDLTAGIGDLAPGESTQIALTFAALADTSLLPGHAAQIQILPGESQVDPDGPLGPLDPQAALTPAPVTGLVQILSPTSVLLSETRVSAQEGNVHLEWQTVSEQDLIGFYLLRALPGQQLTVITPDLIPGQHVGTDQGDRYQYVDVNLTTGRSYAYVLQIVQTDKPHLFIFLGEVNPRHLLYLPLIVAS